MILALILCGGALAAPFLFAFPDPRPEEVLRLEDIADYCPPVFVVGTIRFEDVYVDGQRVWSPAPVAFSIGAGDRINLPIMQIGPHGACF